MVSLPEDSIRIAIFTAVFMGTFQQNLFYFFTHGKTPFSDYSADSSEVESFFFRDFPEIIL